MTRASHRRAQACLRACRGFSTRLLESGALLEALKLTCEATALVDAAELLDRVAVREVNAVVRRLRRRQ